MKNYEQTEQTKINYPNDSVQIKSFFKAGVCKNIKNDFIEWSAER